jgi:hypothetical protein
MRVYGIAVAAPVVVPFIALTWVGTALGWGDTGHKIVCELAFHELTDKARAEVRRLIRKDPEAELKLFAD